MRLNKIIIVFCVAGLTACSTIDEQGTLAQLQDMNIVLKDEKIEGGLEKAMESYQKFLEQTPESHMTPEAIRRLADLKIENENEKQDRKFEESVKASQKTGNKQKRLQKPRESKIQKGKNAGPGIRHKASSIAKKDGESDEEFEKRASAADKIEETKGEKLTPLPDGSSAELNNAGAQEAIALYKKLLKKYPLYERNDQVLYQLSRAYEDMGNVEEAMVVMNKLIKKYPSSRYIDEVQFRRAEYFFIRKKFLDAEEAYKAIVKIGVTSSYYDLALYKTGWTFYKQELYEEALQFFMSLLDLKVSTGYDFEQTENKIEKKRIDDTYRVISLVFSNLSGAESIANYFKKVGKKPYGVGIYSNLAEHYFNKLRYYDAAKTYNAFVTANPLHKQSPHFHMRVIDIYHIGKFPKLVVEGKRSFANAYGLKSEYWKHFDVKSYPKVMGLLQTNIADLAIHYHALYRNKFFVKERGKNFAEASRWYREFMESFPKDKKTPKMHYQLAELLLQGKKFGLAAKEYEKVAYSYLAHDKSSAAGYAAVYAYREHLKVVQLAEKAVTKQEVIRSSLKFADAFPKHEKAPVIIAAVADDLFEIKDYALAINTATKLITRYPNSEKKLRRGAWMIVAHSSYETAKFKNAEVAYKKILSLTGKKDKSRDGLLNNLAASIYKQGEEANKKKDYKTAADHFLRIAKAAPKSSIRKSAEFDAAAVLIKMNDWDRAARVLVAFRKTFNDKKLQKEATKKLAIVYQESEKYEKAALEFERIDREAESNNIRREALILAAKMYEKAEKHRKALRIYQRYVDLFPKPLEYALETRYKIANLYKSWKNDKKYRKELKRVISMDATAGRERTDRTRYLAAESSLVLTIPIYEKFAKIQLKKPFKRNLKRKQRAMKNAAADFNALVKFQVGTVTAAATYYLAEIYYNFSRSLAESERPTKLSKLELEQYELVLEEQIFPFEEKSITVHKKNLELISLGVYSDWIDKSLVRLGQLLPARYAKFEESTGFLSTLEAYEYKFIAKAVEKAPVPANGGAIKPTQDKNGAKPEENKEKTNAVKKNENQSSAKTGIAAGAES